MNIIYKPLAVLLLLSGISFSVQAEDKVCFYEHSEYRGAQWCYGPGDVASIPASMNDDVTSIKTYGNAYAVIFEHGSYGGKYTNVMANTFKMGHMDDGISSIKIKLRDSNDFACLFEHGGFKGTPYCLTAGNKQSNLGNVLMGRNKASSLMVVGNAAIQIFSWPNFRANKKNVTLKRSSSNLHVRPGGWVGDNADSIIVSYQAPSATEIAADINESLSAAAPIRQASTITSHNSYNSTAYFSNQLIPGPNHRRSLIEQLQLGVRAFELDVKKGSDYITVCHSVDCNTSHTTTMRRMIGEVDSWLKGADANDVVYFYLQDSIGDDAGYQQLKNDVDLLGDIVYSPGPCQSGPADLSAEDIRAQGKRVFFYKDQGDRGCDIADNVLINFESSVPVAGMNVYDDFFSASHLRRAYECNNYWCGDTLKSGSTLIALKNGINSVAMDMIEEKHMDTKNNRLNIQLWAIGSEDTSDAFAEGRTVRFTSAGDRYMKLAWDSQQQFACRQDDGSWDVTAAIGKVSAGASTCAAEFSGSRYDVPLSPYEAQLLRAELTAGSDAHVNFGVQNGTWLPGLWGSLSPR